jgi:hypothetical protein
MASVANEAIAVGTGWSRRTGVRWALGGLAAFAVATMLVVAVTVDSGPAPAPAIGERSRVAPLYSADELTMMRLVATGNITAGTIKGEPFLTKRLINKGLVPRATLRPTSPPVPSLYSIREPALVMAVARGQVPMQALESEPRLIQRLINRGLVPPAAADFGSAGR